MSTLLRLAFVALCALVLVARLSVGSAEAEERPLAAFDTIPVLRGDVTVTADVVTVGDLLDGAGAAGSRPLFRSPDLGRSGAIRSDLLVKALKDAGIAEIDTAGFETITVARAGRSVTGEDLAAIARSALADTLGADPDALDVQFDHMPGTVQADPSSSQGVRLANLSRSPSGRFEAVIAIPQGGSDIRVRLTGVAIATMEIVTAVRPIERGETINQDDLVVSRVPAGGVRREAPALADLIGLAARRAIRPGQPLTTADFGPPLMVRRGEMVTLVYRTASLTLSIGGRALADGTAGASVPVVNLRSDRVIQTTVAGPGLVEVTGTPGRILVGQGAQP